MKFNKLTNKIKLSSALIAATTVVGGGILSVPLLLSTNNTNKQIISSNSDYKNLIDQDNNQNAGSSDLSSQPAEIQDFFLNEKTKIYAQNNSQGLFAVVTREDTDVLYAWGYNSHGQLGINSTEHSNIPVLVPNLPSGRITHLVQSIFVTTIVIDGNQIWSTGDNSYYEHGNNSATSTRIFTRNMLWTHGTIKSIHAGDLHRLVVTPTAVFVWGWNVEGQLGTGNNTTYPTPKDITSTIAHVKANWSSGQFFASGRNSAMLVDGELYRWGQNNYGQLATNGTSNWNSPPTTPVWLEDKIAKYSMGTDHSIALLENGNLWSWGNNRSGQLGISTNADQKENPIQITYIAGSIPIKNVDGVFTSSNSTFIQIGNNMYSCGSNASGVLGQDISSTMIYTLTKVSMFADAQILDISANYGTLIVNLKAGLYMAGSNTYGQFGSGSTSSSAQAIIQNVTPFGTPPNLPTKSNNKSYNVDDALIDLKNNTGTFQTMKNTLDKYVDGVANILGSSLTYKSQPVGSYDKTKIAFTLASNSTFNLDGARTKTSFDIPVEITNFRFKDSSLIIKKSPAGMNTGQIQTILNPNPGSIPSDQWLNEIIDMNQFPIGTTFTKIINDEVIGGTGSDGIYKGEIVPSHYYFGDALVTNLDDTGFSFQFSGLTRVADSTFTSTAINPNLTKDNIMIELAPGQAIKPEYLPMFVNSATFPTGAKFIVNDPVIDVKNRTYSCVLSIDKYYEDGLLKTNGSKNFIFNDFKTTQASALVFNGLSDNSIHSANIEELLRAADNTDTINRLFDATSFPSNVKFTVSGTPTLNKEAKTYVGKFTATQAYDNWNTVSNKEVPFEVSNITIFNNSSVDYFELPSEYNIENIEASLINGSEINLEVLKKLININRFPPNTTFTMGVINKDINGGKYTFEIIPNRHYVDGIAVDNSTTKTPYSVTIQFAVPPNLGLIIGLSVGGAALIGLILLSYFKRYELEIAWWNMRATKYKK